MMSGPDTLGEHFSPSFLTISHPQVCQKSGEISLLKQQLKESQAELVQKGSELVALRVALREARAALRVSEGRARGLQEAARTRELELEACSQELQRHRQEAERLREKAGQLDTEAAGLREPPVPPATADPFLLAESDEAKAQRAAAGVGGSLRAQVERLRAELQRERRRGEEQRDSFEEERLAWQAEKEQVIRYQKQLQHNYIQMYTDATGSWSRSCSSSAWSWRPGNSRTWAWRSQLPASAWRRSLPPKSRALASSSAGRSTECRW